MATEFIQNLRSTGGQYTTLTAWDTAKPSDITTSALKVFAHGGITGSLSDGDSVTGNNSGATGTIEMEVTTGQILITVLTGTFQSGEQIYQTLDTNYVVTSDAGDSPILVLECYADWATGLDDYLHMTACTTSATNYIEIRAATGEQHNGTLGTGFYLKPSTGFRRGFDTALNNISYVNFIGLAVDINNVNGNNGFDVHQHQLLENCIAGNTDGGARSGFKFNSSCSLKNCIAVDIGNTSVGFVSSFYADDTVQLYNCVASNCGTGFDIDQYSDRTIDLYNCVAVNCGTDFLLHSSGNTHNWYSCASSDGTAEGDDAIVITDQAFLDPANGNFNIDENSPLYNTGTYNSNVTTDIRALPYANSGGIYSVPIGAFYGPTKVALRSTTGWEATSTRDKAKYHDDYQLASTWEDAIPTDISVSTGTNETYICEMFHDWPTGLVDSLLFVLRTTSIYNKIIFRAAEGHKHNGTPGTGATLAPTSTPWQVINIECSDVEIRGIDCILAKASATATCIRFTTENGVIDGNILRTNNGTQGFGIQYSNSKPNHNRTASNNFIKDFDTGINLTRQCFILNNTIVDCDEGINDDEPIYPKKLQNNVCYNNTNDFIFGTLNPNTIISHNASSDTSSIGQGAITGITSAEFVDSANDNYYLKSTSQLRRAGVNSTRLFTNDIDSRTRRTTGAWDIGFDEYEEANTVAIPVLKEHVPGFSSTEKPTIPVSIDETHPLAEFLHDVYLFDDKHVKSIRNHSEISITDTVYRYPDYLHVSPTGTDGNLIIDAVPLADWAEATIIIEAKHYSNSGDILHIVHSGSDSIRIYRPSSSTVTVRWDDGTQTDQDITLTSTDFHTFATSHNGSFQKTYLDGELIDSDNDTFNFSTADDGEIRVGTTLTDVATNVGAKYLFIFKKQLPDAIVKELTDNPYQLLKPAIETYNHHVEAESVIYPVSLPKQWTPGFWLDKKPTIPVVIDETHSLVPTNYWLLNGGGIHDLISDNPLIYTGAIGTEKGNLELSGTQNANYAYSSQLIESSSTEAFIVQAKFRIDSLSVQTAIFQWADSYNDSNPFLYYTIDPDGHLNIYFDGTYGYSGSTDLTGKDLTVTTVAYYGGAYYHFINDELVHTGSGGSIYSHHDVSNKFWLYTGFHNTSTAAVQYHHLYYKRGHVPLDEIYSFAKTPYQVLKPAIEHFGYQDGVVAASEETIDFSVSENLLAGQSFTQQETTSFSASENLYTGQVFSQQEITGFSVSENLYEGQSFTQQETTGFSVSENLYNGQTFEALSTTPINFSISENLFEGQSFTQQETTLFNSSENLYTGLNADISLQTNFSLSEEQIIGLGFTQLETSAFEVSENLFAGLQFDLLETIPIVFSISENLFEGLNYTITETTTFSISENLYEGQSFSLSLVTPYSVSENIYSGQDFTLLETEYIQFSASESLYSGLSFIIGLDTKIDFFVSENIFEGQIFDQIESTSFSESINYYTGQSFTQLETTQFLVSEQAYIGIDFATALIIPMAESYKPIEGLLFDLLETEYTIFNISENLYSGLVFNPYQDFATIPRDAVRFKTLINRKIKQDALIATETRYDSNIRRTLRNKVEL